MPGCPERGLEPERADLDVHTVRGEERCDARDRPVLGEADLGLVVQLAHESRELGAERLEGRRDLGIHRGGTRRPGIHPRGRADTRAHHARAHPAHTSTSSPSARRSVRRKPASGPATTSATPSPSPNAPSTA